MTKTEFIKLREKLIEKLGDAFFLDGLIKRIDESPDQGQRNNIIKQQNLNKIKKQKEQTQKQQNIINQNKPKRGLAPKVAKLPPKPKPISNLNFNDTDNNLDQLSKNEKDRNIKNKILKGEFDNVAPIQGMPDEYKDKFMRGKMKDSNIRTIYDKDTNRVLKTFKKAKKDDYDNMKDELINKYKKQKEDDEENDNIENSSLQYPQLKIYVKTFQEWCEDKNKYNKLYNKEIDMDRKDLLLEALRKRKNKKS